MIEVCLIGGCSSLHVKLQTKNAFMQDYIFHVWVFIWVKFESLLVLQLPEWEESRVYRQRDLKQWSLKKDTTADWKRMWWSITVTCKPEVYVDFSKVLTIINFVIFVSLVCTTSQKRLMSNISRDLRKWAIQKGDYTSCSLKKWKGVGCWKMA